MRRTGIVLASALVAVLCTSCSDGSDHSGGHPVMGTTDLVSNLDPAGAYDQGSWILYGNVFQTLMSFAPGVDQPKPDAARSCHFEDKETVYTCTMRSGLKFSNGDELTAQDVAYSFNREKTIWDIAQRSTGGRQSYGGPWPLLSNLKSVKASGDTVTFDLAGADATFPMKIASGAGSIVDHTVYPADKLLTGGRLMGSGPYVLKSYSDQKEAVLGVNSDYTGAYKPHNTGATIKYYADPQSLADALKGKKVDFVPRDLPPAVENSYENGSGSDYQTVSISSGTERIMVFDSTHAPFDKLAVRQAVAALVDRGALADKIFQRTVTPLYSLLPQGVPGHANAFFDAYGTGPDATKAGDILRQAGIHTPVQFTLSYSTGTAPTLEAQELARELDASGLFKVTLHHVATLRVLENAWSKNQLQAFTVGWSSDYPDPDDFIAPLLETNGVFSDGYDNPSITEWLKESRTKVNRGDADDLFAKVEKQEAHDVPILPLWQSKDYAVSASDVQGASLSTNSTGVTCLWQVSVGDYS
jgi:peptide/nickel transport system substrate-binding protein